MAEIKLNKGFVTIVDDHRFDELSKFHWYVDFSGKKFYVKRRERVNGKNKTIYLHRQVMGVTEKGVLVDHRKGDTMLNRESDLRVCTHAENVRNAATNINETGFKGVSKNDVGKKWRARIYFGKEIMLGYSDCPETCARTYNEAAKKYYGEFAFLNDVPDGPLCESTILSNHNASGFIGVYFSKQAGKHMATVGKDGKKYHVGTFDDPKDAAIARDAKAIELYGPDYKKLNFPLPLPRV